MLKSYRGPLPKPDKRGYVRPEVGDKRFTVGNVRSVCQAEMERRLSALRDLFDNQCTRNNTKCWMPAILPYAKQIAAGERPVFKVSQFAKEFDGQASEEAQGLQILKDLGLDLVPDDPGAIVRGEGEFRKLISAAVRTEVARVMTNVDQRFEGYPQELVERLRSSIPQDMAQLETRTFSNAIDGYRRHLRKTGKRQENGMPSPSVQNYLRLSKGFKPSMDDLQLWEVDKNKLDELFGYWRNRPVSQKTGKRISGDHAKHKMDCLWAIFVWIDESSDWKWEFPKGARRIKRTPETLDSDRKARRSRRISSNTYSPKQLALIAETLNQFEKMILGVCVNCAMQPAEVGRLEVNDYYNRHPETGEIGDWIVFDRPKTHEYGEWRLWPEVADLVKWGCRRSRQLDCERLVVTDAGIPWYREDWKNPAARFAKWWQAEPSDTCSAKGVVTKLCRDTGDFPRYTIKWLRKILPNLVRPKFGKEVADLINARKVDRSGRVAGRDTDRYADRLYGEAANAVMELEDYFRPFLNALKCPKTSR